MNYTESVDERLNRLTQANRSMSARRNLALTLALKLLDEGELFGTDWDYISEDEVKRIDEAINNLKYKAYLEGFKQGVNFEMQQLYKEYPYSEYSLELAKTYAEHREWHDT